MTRTPVTVAPHLRPRELEVLECLANGLSIAETADAMNIEQNTVMRYRDAIYRKLGANSGGQAVAVAYQTGIFVRPGCACHQPQPRPEPGLSRSARRAITSGGIDMPPGLRPQTLEGVLRAVDASLVHLDATSFEYVNHRTQHPCSTTVYALEELGFVDLHPDGEVTITADGQTWRAEYLARVADAEQVNAGG